MVNVEDPLKRLKIAASQALSELQIEQNRTECFRFYMTAEEARQLRELCQGVKPAKFIRSKVFGYAVSRPRTIIPQINQEAYAHISNIRSNINQIAKAVNVAAKRGQTLPLTENHLAQLSKLEHLLETIGAQLSQAQNADRQEEEP